jgi:hypothetical protein
MRVSAQTMLVFFCQFADRVGKGEGLSWQSTAVLSASCLFGSLLARDVPHLHMLKLTHCCCEGSIDGVKVCCSCRREMLRVNLASRTDQSTVLQHNISTS